MTTSEHLTPEELIDLAEGTRSAAALPHLSVCATCREQLTELRTLMALLQDADVPEPSPLFWHGFSRRLNETIAHEPSSGRRWLAWLQPRLALPVAAAALAAAALAVGLRPSPSVAPRPSPPAARSVAADAPSAEIPDIDDDSSLALVAGLTANIDLSEAADAGLTSRESAEHAVTHMNRDELATLQRLLKEAMARRGA